MSEARQEAAVCVFSERSDVALELLSIGRQLADGLDGPLVSVVLGSSTDAPPEHLERGADEVLVVEASNRRALGGADDGLAALAAAVERTQPAAVLIGATVLGSEIAARLGQRLRVGCASDCLELQAESRGLRVERRCLGRFVAEQLLTARPALTTIPARRFEPPARTGRAEGRCARLVISAPSERLRVVQVLERERSPVDLGKAAAIVAVGRGLRQAEDLGVVAELADAVGGVLAATRPITDHLGWLPQDVKIGLSGQTVAPELYVACGVSGQIEHVVGMTRARIVVAINTDPSAPMLAEADYQVVGDLYEIVPVLAEAVRSLSARSERVHAEV